MVLLVESKLNWQALSITDRAICAGGEENGASPSTTSPIPARKLEARGKDIGAGAM